MSSASFESVGSRKRNFGDLKGSWDNNNNTDNTMFLDITATKQPVARSKFHSSTTQLISSSSSSSCEESCSSSSNDSAQTYSDVASEPHTVSCLVSNCHPSAGKAAQKRKHSDQNEDPSFSLSNLHRRNIQVVGQIGIAREPRRLIVWGDLNWNFSSPKKMLAEKNEGNVTVGISLATNITTIHASTPTICCTRSKHSKVQGVLFATTESLHSERMDWDDTHWELSSLSSTTKKRKTMGLLTISTENDTSSTNNDSATTINEMGRSLKSRSKRNILPRKNDSVKRRFCKRLIQADNTEQQNYISQMPMIPNHETGITCRMKNQHLGVHRLSFIDSPYIIYRWLRVRLAAGLVRSSFEFLHRILKKYYDQVNEIVKNLEKNRTQKDEFASLVSLRDRLADIWCVYAHFTLEVGCLVYARARERKRSSWKKIVIQNNNVDNGRGSRTKETIDTVEIGGGTEITSCSKKSNSTSNFEDDQDIITVRRNRSIPPPTPSNQAEKSFSSAARQNDSQLIPKINESPENTASSFTVMIREIYKGRYCKFIEYTKIRNLEEFKATPATKLAEMCVEYRDISGLKAYTNKGSLSNFISTLKAAVRKIDNDSSGNRVEKYPSPAQTAQRLSMEHTPQEEREINISKVQNDLTFDDFSNHAISILMTARDCPLVGNHIAIGVSLGRLIVSSTVMKASKTDCARVELSRETLSTNIQSAIDVCWDSIDVCQYNRRTNIRYAIRPVSKTAIRSLSSFEFKCDKSNWEKEVRIQVQEGIKSTLLLPMTLRNSLSSTSFLSEGMVINDKDTIRCLCKELNRWSRLGEKLEMNSQHTIRITPSYDSEMFFAAEELPLYATLKSLSDPLNHYEDAVNPGKGIIWQW